MRWMIGIAFVGSLAASRASACDYHEGFGLIGGQTYDGYEGYGTTREAMAIERRERAMEAAKQSFLTRFNIRADDPAQFSVAPDTASMKQNIDVDRRAEPAAQDR
jgi:hypothetical protein